MSRTNQQSELGFGSDSFLDIVANIVGILIILIVVAGVKVSKTPVVIAEPEIEENVEVAQQPSEPLPPEWLDQESADERVVVIEPPKEEPVAPVKREPSPQLLSREKELARQLADFENKIKRTRTRLTAFQADDAKLKQKLKTVSLQLDDQTRSLDKSKEAINGLSITLDKSKAQLLALQKKLKKLENQEAPVEKIRHKLTPISSTVTGKELHFRLMKNRVSVVPIERLTERLKAQIQRQKDWLLRFRRHQGHVGPVDGFSMVYVVERQAMSVLDQLRDGRGYVRIGVTQWQIETNNNVVEENLQEAIEHGSNFSQALLMADAEETTLTFWVYPDSFKLYRQLQKVAQNEGFTVAGRPMPFGVPIAGSPQGTRSAGQ